MGSILILTVVSAATADSILYGVNVGNSSGQVPNGGPNNNGALVVVDQTTGEPALVGRPDGISRLSGLAFASADTLYASTINIDATSDLIRIDPDTGALLSDIGTIVANGVPLQIADLALQPGPGGALYGISSASRSNFAAAGKLYRIDTNTGEATLVGSTGDFFGAIAFAPNGTLYFLSADLDLTNGAAVNFELETLNPTNAQTLATVDVPNPEDPFAPYSSMGVRPEDGTIFAGDGDSDDIFTINPLTGEVSFVGDSSPNFIGDFDFRPAAETTTVPEPATMTVSSVGLLLVCVAVAARRRKVPQARSM
jgi:outer membrane protein assembly factor BamB